ncbi:MAG TPA: glycosyltransferase family 2 protein [Candidatus Saccharimonadales bacterium]
MNQQLPSLSVVIPAYNERDHMRGCIEALLEQVDELEEIIVVDNNSTDETVAIVKAFQKLEPRITLLHEKKQGAIAARDAGLHAATTDLIGRIDADTYVQPGWARAARTFFANPEHATISAASGPSFPHDAPFQRIVEWFITAFFNSNGDHGKVKALFGSNMIIRRLAWQLIEPEVCRRHDIMEDLDIAVHLTKHGTQVAVIPDMRVGVSSRRIQTNPVSYWRYQSLWPNTYAVHGMKLVAARIWLAAIFGNIIQLIIVVPARAFNPHTRRFSLTYLFGFAKESRERELPYEHPRQKKNPKKTKTSKG